MKNLDILEKKLNIATELMEELNFDDIEICVPTIPDITDIEIIQPKNLTEPIKEEEVFSIDSLKNDFIMIRSNVLQLISTGQRILASASVIDVSDMKAPTLNALASLQETLGNNLHLMVTVYKEICEIEKMRMCVNGKPVDGVGSQNISTGNVTNNTQIVFSGGTADLLKLIKDNS